MNIIVLSPHADDVEIAMGGTIAKYVDEGHNIETEVKLFYRLYEAIICSAYEFEADFIFKPLRQHSSLRRALFTSTDWNLIRFCIEKTSD